MTAAESAQLTDRILDVLPNAAGAIARAVGRKPSDGTVRRRLAKLEQEGLVEQVDGVWRGCHELPDIEGYVYPDDLDDEARALLLQAVDRLQDQGTFEDVDVGLVEDYVRAKQRARRAQAEADESPFTYAETGRAFTHPAIAIARQAERDAQVYAAELLLTPRARAQAGIDSHADPGDGDED